MVIQITLYSSQEYNIDRNVFFLFKKISEDKDQILWITWIEVQDKRFNLVYAVQLLLTINYIQSMPRSESESLRNKELM